MKSHCCHGRVGCGARPGRRRHELSFFPGRRRARFPGPECARIAEIMQRLRDVQTFDAVAVAPNGKTVAWTVAEKAPADKSGKAPNPRAANNGKPGQILQMADADGSHVRAVTIPPVGEVVPLQQSQVVS